MVARTEDLRHAGTTCHEVGRLLESPATAFKMDAAPTARCFGLVEGASEHLGEHYLDFYTEINDYVTDLRQKLGTSGEALLAASRRLEAVEKHTRAEITKLPIDLKGNGHPVPR
ncbi:hypothetical protein GCM10022226_56290 [Sphaerisporangium flaviroseum]|uniref:ESX-1 secretion-associated protein n=2 Tax=Sphaerisporangium flaviroseum TaxID=509199 RepID=A0ABP7IW90_9ACTN